MLYRSRFTRWVLIAVALWIAYILIFGDPDTWRTAPSLVWAVHNVRVPMPAWGCVFIAYAALLVPARTRPVGFAVGAALFAVFGVSLIVTVGTGGPKSAIAIGGIVDLITFHLYAVKTSLAANYAERERP